MIHLNQVDQDHSSHSGPRDPGFPGKDRESVATVRAQ